MKTLGLFIALFGLSTAVHAAPPANLLGKWKLNSRACTDGTQVKESANPAPKDLSVEFDANEIFYSRDQGTGCTMDIKEAYEVKGNMVSFKNSMLTVTDSCTGAQLQIKAFTFAFAVNGDKLQITLDPLKPQACPAGQRINYNFDRK